jgi:hypothetical protein
MTKTAPTVAAAAIMAADSMIPTVACLSRQS